MRLTQIAFALTLLTLGATVFFAWEARQESRGAREQLELMKRQQEAQMEASTAPVGPPASVRPPVPGQLAPSAPTQPPPIAQKNGLIQELSTVPSATQPPAPVLPIPAPAPLTELQKRIIAMPTIAKVKEYQADAGFVVITAGKSQRISKGTQFDLRRENAVIGRITVGDIIEDGESIADLDSKSVPPGVTVKVDDEVIQVVAP